MKRPKPLEIVAIFGVIIVVVVVLWPVFPGGKYPAERAVCLSNLKQLATGHLMYVSDYDEKSANRDVWMDVLVPYTKNKELFYCPGLKEQKNPQLYGYCFNAALSNQKLGENLEQLVFAFDSINLARNASGTLETLPKGGRHKNKVTNETSNTIAYADGHAKAMLVSTGP